MTAHIKSRLLWSIVIFLLACCSQPKPVVHHYTVVANSSKQYLFVFDKHLLIPHHAALLRANGELLQAITDSLNALPAAVQAATFYKDSLLLLTLEDGSLLTYTLHSGHIHHLLSEDTVTAIRGDAFLLSSHTALRLHDESFDGLNFTGNDLIATDLQTGASCTLVKNVSRLYQQGDSLFFTKDFHQLFTLDSNGACRKLLSLPDSVSQLTGGDAYSAYLTWEHLSPGISRMYERQNNKDYSSRISAAGAINNVMQTEKYALKVVDNKTGKAVLCDSFPEKGFDVQAIRFVEPLHLLVAENRRDSPLVKRVEIISLEDLQRHVLPDESVVINATADYLVLLHHELTVYDLHTYQEHAVVTLSDSTAVLADGSCCGMYYFSIGAPGGTSSVQELDVQEGSVREVKRLRW